MATDLSEERMADLRRLHGEAVSNKGGDFEVDTDEAFRIAFMEWAPALLRAAEERERMATNERMMMARLSGYDECPEDPVAAVMHVADCFDAMTGACVQQVQERDRLRAQRDALVAVLEQCDVFLRVHAKPDNELKTAVQAAIRAAKENQ